MHNVLHIQADSAYQPSCWSIWSLADISQCVLLLISTGTYVYSTITLCCFTSCYSQRGRDGAD